MSGHGNIFVAVGDEVRFAKTVAESDVYLFAGITGDFSSNHINEMVMRRSKFGRRVAHGALIVGYMSAASTRMIETHGAAAAGRVTAVALGYDRVRFVAPVFIGDTISVSYRIVRLEPERQRSYADITVVNQAGETVAVATHILKWVADEPAAADAPDGPEVEACAGASRGQGR